MARCRHCVHIIWAIGVAGSGAPPANQHPLCTALEKFSSNLLLQTSPSKFECRGRDDGLECFARGVEGEPVPTPCDGDPAARDEGLETLDGQVRSPQTASKSCPQRVALLAGLSWNRGYFLGRLFAADEEYAPPSQEEVMECCTTGFTFKLCVGFVPGVSRYRIKTMSCLSPPYGRHYFCTKQGRQP